MKLLHVSRNILKSLAATLLLIPLGTFAQIFEDVAPQLGVNITSPYGDVFALDYDGDGDNDLLFTSRFYAPDRYFRNSETGYTEVDINLPEVNDGGKVLPMDFDHDGDLDVVINCYHTQTYLMMNEGGTLVDRTAEWGISTETGGRDIACVDFNHDGLMDIILGFRWSGFRLYRNSGDGFVDVTEFSQLPDQGDFARFCEGDVNLDGETDLFMTTVFAGEDYFYVNQGNGIFEDRTNESGLSAATGHGGCLWVDFDNDRYPDLLTGGNGHHAIWHNNHDLTFTEMNVHGMDVNFDTYAFSAEYAVADFDQDKDLDIYAGQPNGGYDGLKPNQFFRQDSINGMDIYFTDIAPELGMDLGPDTKPQFFDYDNDGDLDLFLRMYGVPSRLYRNNLNGADRLEIQALGPNGEKDCWLTRVEVYKHGTESLVASGETNYGGANRSGLNHYFVVNEDSSYDLRVYFANGAVMLPSDFPELSGVVPSSVAHKITVHRFDGATSADHHPVPIPDNLTVHAYPNPFNSTTTLRVELAEPSNMAVSVFDLQGRLVKSLAANRYEAGTHLISWSAQAQSSGIYFARISAGSYSRNVKLILLK